MPGRGKTKCRCSEADQLAEEKEENWEEGERTGAEPAHGGPGWLW